MSKVLADLLYPHVEKSLDDWMVQYPPRALPEGAQVTRFAPSPTGFVHIGSIFTSLISRRTAHQTGGVFILRIEDTDKKREKDGSVEEIVRNLINFDLTPDEGITQIDPEREIGAYAPYTQSERVAEYEAFAKFLVERGLAYPAFDTEEELERLRKIQEAQRLKPGYYGSFAKWRDAKIDAVQAELDKGNRPVIRIRAPNPSEARIKFIDVVKGAMDMPINDQDSVLVKSNRLPTYHFAVVVDDTLMRVNLVVRGDEWLPSAPLHLQLYEYFGLPAPRFAHIAPIATMDNVIGEDGQAHASKRKLSKRKDPEANVMYFYEQGYPKAAVTEYLLNLANSSFYDWRKANPSAPNADFQLRIENMGVASPLFDVVKLNDISKEIIATYNAEQVYDAGVTWARQYQPRLAALLERNKDYSLRVFSVERGGAAPRKDIVNWSDIERACGLFFDERYDETIAATGYPFPEKVPAADVARILEHVLAFDLVRTKDEWLTDMRDFSESVGYARDVKSFKKNPDAYKGQFGDVMMVVRVALSGKTNTPDLYEILQTLGAVRAYGRLRAALAQIERA
ncbi:MAG: glutamate--tRNA ligase family protein [Chloroflexota bacterium]|nr:glutamate--tRNA ligase family protein [Chloroflexota bacterium]